MPTPTSADRLVARVALGGVTRLPAGIDTRLLRRSPYGALREIFELRRGQLVHRATVPSELAPLQIAEPAGGGPLQLLMPEQLWFADAASYAARDTELAFGCRC